MSVLKQLQQTFLLEEIDQTTILDSSKLVREIKNYPIIYDNNLRRDQTSIFKAWENICASMLPSFPSMSENNKIATRKRLRDRWSYMRSTFRRDIFNNNIDCHKYLDWIREINFLVPILTRPSETKSSTKNSRQRAKYKSLFNKKKTQQKASSTTTTTTFNNNSGQSPTPEANIINEPETVAIQKSESSISDVIISCDSSSSDKSTTLDISSNTTEIAAPDKSPNDIMVETFMSTFSISESALTTPLDPDQTFLLAMLQSYRLVRNENKEALQHKFYTFLRD